MFKHGQKVKVVVHVHHTPASRDMERGVTYEGEYIGAHERYTFDGEVRIATGLDSVKVRDARGDDVVLIFAMNPTMEVTPA